MKQTAVEFLIDQLEQKGEASVNVSIGRMQISIKEEDYNNLIDQAKEMEKENQKHIGQITEKGIIDTIGNCANCGVEFHIHKDVTQKQQQGYSDEDLIDAFNEGQALNVRGKLIQGKEWFKQLKDK